MRRLAPGFLRIPPSSFKFRQGQDIDLSPENRLANTYRDPSFANSSFSFFFEIFYIENFGRRRQV